jgi:hypothetical protein
MHMECKKHTHCHHTSVEDAIKILGRGSNSRVVVGATTVLLAQASNKLANIHTLLLVCIAMLKLRASEA